MPENTLHDVAEEARHAVIGLEALIEKQRRTSHLRYLYVLFVYIPVSMLIAMTITISIASGCFLGEGSEFPGICNVIPGYKTTLQRQTEFNSRFEELYDRTSINDKRLDRLERIERQREESPSAERLKLLPQQREDSRQ